MDHVNKHGEPKILNECKLPLTGKGVVDRIVTDRAVIDVEATGLKLVEVAEGWTPEEVIAATEPELQISDQLRVGTY